MADLQLGTKSISLTAGGLLLGSEGIGMGNRRWPRYKITTAVVANLNACSESGTYFAPAEGSLEELKEYTRGLPVEDPPEIFGLHPNADITFQQVHPVILYITIIEGQTIPLPYPYNAENVEQRRLSVW